MRLSLPHPLASSCLIQDFNQHNLHTDDGSQSTHLGPQIAKPQTSSSHPPNPISTLLQEDYLCPLPLEAVLATLLTDNLPAHILPDSSTFENKIIQWYPDLLLNQNNEMDDMISFKNGILVAYGMCPPCELLVPRHELPLIRLSSKNPTNLMQSPLTEILGLADA
jgi:hypothetical protein